MRSVRSLAVFIATLGLVVSVAAARPGIPPADGAFLSRTIADCGGDCDGCGLYKTRLIIWEGEWWPYPYGCTQTPCPLKCQPMLQSGELPLEESVALLEAAVASGDEDALIQLLTGQPRLEVNSSRGMVQAIGCDDAVVAMVPLSESTLRTLAAE